MWKSYFPRGHIIDKSQLAEPRITILSGDQSDKGFLQSVGSAHGPFDIVMDGGNHRSDDVIASFESLFPHVRNGGVYAIEDIQTSYWPRFGADATNLNSPSMSMGYVKHMVDRLNWAEWTQDGKTTPFQREITGIRFYHDLVFIDRGLNTERGGDPLSDQEQ